MSCSGSGCRGLRRVGILGGMGPQATVLLLQKIIDATPALDDAEHIPLIVDQNPQVPSRIRHLLEGSGEDPGPVLAAMARRLQAAGAEALAMPCNTAHHYAPAVRAAVSLPLIDMVALSVAHAVALAGPGGTVGILASPAVRRIGLFDGPLARAGLRAVHPDDDDALLAVIRGIKAGNFKAGNIKAGNIKAGGSGAGLRGMLTALSCGLIARGAAVQMIACTEFSLIADAAAPDATAFDTLDLLAADIIAFATSAGAGRTNDKAALQPPGQGAVALDNG